MKTTLPKKRKLSANTLLTTLTICWILGTSTAGYLMLIQQQNRFSVRSQTWNLTMAVVEAGIEEGLQHLNNDYGNLASDGWSFDGTAYSLTRSLGANSYTVYITNAANPVVVARATVAMPAMASGIPTVFFASDGVSVSTTPTTVSRAVLVTTIRSSLLPRGMVARNTINLNGNNVTTDSFDSGDPLHSASGQYPAGQTSKLLDGGDVSSDDTIINSINVGNANIYGHVSTGPGGTVAIGPNGAVGSHAWQLNHNGIESGWVANTANFTFPQTSLPNTSGYLTPTSGYITNGATVTHYDNILLSGNYVANSLSGATYIGGTATLVLPNGLNMGGGDSITIGPAGAATVYAGGNSTVVVNGNGVINQPGYAANFILYCAPTVTSFTLNGNAGFNGVLIAPSVALSLNGGGNNTIDFIGALAVNSIVLNGHFNFHYDEALSRLPANGRFLVNSWSEVH